MGRPWAALLVLAGCYGPHAQPGGACANGLCPSGLTCVGGVCTDGTQAIDAPVTIDGKHVDAATPIDAAPFAVRIDLAGPAYTGIDHPGAWVADPGTCDGLQFDSPTPTINGTNDSTLYVNQKYGGILTCAITSIPPGMYKVTLLFAELRLGGMPCTGPAGQTRVFDIALEGTNVATGLDMTTTGGGCAASGGPGHAFDRAFDVAITDGSLDVVETASMGAAALDAIEVVAL